MTWRPKGLVGVLRTRGQGMQGGLRLALFGFTSENTIHVCVCVCVSVCLSVCVCVCMCMCVCVYVAGLNENFTYQPHYISVFKCDFACVFSVCVISCILGFVSSMFLHRVCV